jgi:hypothetical protein
LENHDALLAAYSPLLATFNASLPDVKQVTSSDLLASSAPQHLLTTTQTGVRVAAFIASRDTPRERHVVETTLKCNGNWLDAPYGVDVMDPLAWRCAARFRLGKPIFSRPVKCPCCASGLLDIYGIHATFCTGDGDCVNRHNAVRDLIVALAKSGKMSVLDREPGYLLSDSVSGEKPADVYFHNWKLGQGLCVDVCIANSLEFSSDPAPFNPMEPLINKENLKRGKYQAKCTERGYLFMPFVCGSLGGFSDDAVVIMKEIGAAIAVAQGISKGVAVDRIRKRNGGCYGVSYQLPPLLLAVSASGPNRLAVLVPTDWQYSLKSN